MSTGIREGRIRMAIRKEYETYAEFVLERRALELALKSYVSYCDRENGVYWIEVGK